MRDAVLSGARHGADVPVRRDAAPGEAAAAQDDSAAAPRAGEGPIGCHLPHSEATRGSPVRVVLRLTAVPLTLIYTAPRKPVR